MTDRCEECGFDYDGFAVADVPAAVRRLGQRYRAPLTRFLPGEDGATLVRVRPSDDVWSALEYACHVRDVFAVQRDRLELALAVSTPEFEPMGREERVVNDRYNEQDPETVASELADNADTLATLFGELTDAQLARTGLYAYPQVQERTLGWIGIHTVHEGEHHLLDVGRVLRAARGR